MAVMETITSIEFFSITDQILFILFLQFDLNNKMEEFIGRKVLTVTVNCWYRKLQEKEIKANFDQFRC